MPITSLVKYRHLKFFGIHLAMGGAFIGALFAFYDPKVTALFVGVLLIAYIALVKRFDYLDPLVGYLIPWIVILLFSATDLSHFATGIHRQTYSVILTGLIGAIFGAGGRRRRTHDQQLWLRPLPSRLNSAYVFTLLDASFIVLTLFNILTAGYIPLLRGFSTGETGYLDFGIHGVYGFYLAFANAFAIISLVIFLRTGKTFYILRYCAILIILVLLVTRQNIISVAIESAVAYSLVRGRMRGKTILVSLALGGVLFSVAGNFRSGDIRQIAGIKDEYHWVPDPVIWLYAYSYFNIANVDNLVMKSDAPYYNGASISTLIPSFLRPEIQIDDYRLIENFNVSSYMFQVYEDTGRIGIFLLSICGLWVTNKQFRLVGKAMSVSRIGTFAVLYFCATFSFFINFWVYLPIIFQIIFFILLGNISELACQSTTIRNSTDLSQVKELSA